MLETGINIIEWPSLQYCTMSAFGGDALQRKAMSHKSGFIIIDDRDLNSIHNHVYPKREKPYDIYKAMSDDHFARMCAAFKDFLGKLLVLGDFRGVR